MNRSISSCPKWLIVARTVGMLLAVSALADLSSQIGRKANEKYDPILEAAAAHGSASAAKVLMAAVTKTPTRSEYWLELIRKLRNGDNQFVTECVSREALERCPNDPSLLLERARVLSPEAALDVLADLARIPGHEIEARDAMDGATTDRSIPKAGERPNYNTWLRGLVETEQWDRVDEIAGRALADRPDESKQFQAFRAMALAANNKFDEAMIAQRASGFLQSGLCDNGPIRCLGDLLLVKAKPKLAIKSFGSAPLPNFPAPSEWLVLAQAQFVTGDRVSADAVLDRCGFMVRDLMRIADRIKPTPTKSPNHLLTS